MMPWLWRVNLHAVEQKGAGCVSFGHLEGRQSAVAQLAGGVSSYIHPSNKS